MEKYVTVHEPESSHLGGTVDDEGLSDRHTNRCHYSELVASVDHGIQERTHHEEPRPHQEAESESPSVDEVIGGEIDQ